MQEESTLKIFGESNDNNTGGHPINKEKNKLRRYYHEFYKRNARTVHKVVDVKEIRIHTANSSHAEKAEDILEDFNIIFPSCQSGSTQTENTGYWPRQ
jgi:hypothetical protein